MAVRYTKASGFHGAVCWECYVVNQREYHRNWRRGTPTRPAEKNEYLEARVKYNTAKALLSPAMFESWKQEQGITDV